MPDNAPPADADIFHAGGEPEILHRADRTIEIHVGLMGSPEYDGAGAAAIAGDADPDRRLDDSLQLEPAVGFLLLVLEHPGSFQVCGLKRIPHPLLDGAVPDDDEVPGLHETDRRCMVSRSKKARQHLIWNRIGEKLPAHVAAVEDAFVDGVSLGGGELGVGLNVVGFHRLLFWFRTRHWRRDI